MKTTSKLPENSVTHALDELNRLERDRASFASDKRMVGEQLGRQGRELGELRRRLLAERPRAWARHRREHDRRREWLEHEHQRHAARAEAEHRERLAMYTAELEDKRRQLAALDADPILERPGRRMMEWMIPAAATVLVAFFAILAVGENDDVIAHAAVGSTSLTSPVVQGEPDSAAPIDADPVVDSNVDPNVDSSVDPNVDINADVDLEPMAIAPELAQSEPVQAKPVKPVAKKPKAPKAPKSPKKPPLLILDPNGDPLG
jgi:hypothetical protein